ncbi:hypothetical protein UlMin_033608 [Ulmus minor]
MVGFDEPNDSTDTTTQINQMKKLEERKIDKIGTFNGLLGYLSFNSSQKPKYKYGDLGLSSASLEIADAENGATGIFSGNLSLDVTEGTKWNIGKGGFCRMWSKKFDGFIDLDPFDTIIYTENWVNSLGQEEDNSWQAFVFVPKDNWYITKIPLAQYLPIWRGNVIDAQLEMNPSRVVGMSLSDNAEGGVPGAKSGPRDFRVDLDWIKALRSQ